MVDKTEEQSTMPPESTPEIPVNKTIPVIKPGKTGFPLLTTFLVIVALLCAIYAAFISMQLRQDTQQQIQSLHNAFTTLKETTHTAIAKNLQRADQSQNAIKEIDKTLQTAMQQRFYQKQDWLLLKARYYLELAQVNAHWSLDQQSTIALLQQADTLLQTLPDQQLFPIRQAIAQEIAQLQALPKIDIAGLLSQLDAAKTLASTLPLSQPSNKTADDGNKPTENVTASTWRERIQDSMNQLKKLVIIRHHEGDMEPILSPLYLAMLRESIYSHLQEAQWAILHNNQDVYQLALTETLKDIKRAFDEKNPETQALIKQLEALQNKSLLLEKITIDKSLTLLNQVIDTQNLSRNKPSTATEGDQSQ